MEQDSHTAPVIVMIEHGCAKGKEADYNDWYNANFFPFLAGIPGVSKVERYERAEDDETRPRFLSVVYLENEEAIHRMAQSGSVATLGRLFFENAFRWQGETRWSTRYTQISTTETQPLSNVQGDTLGQRRLVVLH